MMNSGVILYGPPAAGKSTVTRELRLVDSRFELFRRLKAGRGRTDEYRMVTPESIKETRQRGEVVWQNERYGSVYVIDRPGLALMMRSKVPVVHLGQVEAVPAVTGSLPGMWLVVYLWCPRDIALARIDERSTGDTETRLKAWDATPELPTTDLVIDTSEVPASEAARRIFDAHRQKDSWRAQRRLSSQS